MKKLVTGITVSGKLTLGNYLGVMKRLKHLTNDYESYIFVANLHGLTNPWDIKNSDFIKQTYSIAALYIAIGLNKKNTNIFIQSEIPEILELTYLLGVQTTMGELSRMTQFKDKSSKLKLKNGTKFIPTGLFYYPVLQTADILGYQANVVPVGADQKQHIEFARNVATRFNNKYSPIFSIPESLISKSGSKIMALGNPENKMSKSDKVEKNTIYILDSPEKIRKKISQAVTDSENKIKYDLKNKPGISNLIVINSLLSKSSIKEVEKKYKNLSYKNLKEDTAQLIVDEFSPIQENYKKLLNSKILKEILENGKKKASIIVGKTLQKVKKEMGII